MHRRLQPKVHGFSYRIFMFAVDLDELAELHGRLGLFSVNRPNLYSFREGDYLPTDGAIHNGEARGGGRAAAGSTLKDRVVAFAAQRGVEVKGGRVVLVTLPRVFGYLFNPVSFYFCSDRSGKPLAAIAEVTNTFREMKPYFLGPDSLDNGAFRRTEAKHFYVSPFSDVDVEFDFTLPPPGERLSIQVDDLSGRQLTLTSTLRGTRRELTGLRLAWFSLKYPLITLRIIALIHGHAAILWLKRLPSFAKAARAGDQRDLYRPHASIARHEP
jgi:DUF1365 family protein